VIRNMLSEEKPFIYIYIYSWGSNEKKIQVKFGLYYLLNLEKPINSYFVLKIL
jgi:hypothetical protein